MTYQDFVVKYGDRPKDIIWAVSALDAAEAERGRIITLLQDLLEMSQENISPDAIPVKLSAVLAVLRQEMPK